jgi:hypothetical protein
MYTTILNGIIVVLFTYFLSNNSNILVKLMSSDSLLNALSFLKVFITKRTSSESQILEFSNVYDVPLIDRYLCYIITSMFYKIICTFLWINKYNIIEIFISLITIPSIFDKIAKSKIYPIIQNYKEYIINIIIAQKITLFIKYYSKNYLKKKIRIKYYDILPHINNYKDTANHIFEILKNCLLLFIFSQLKGYSSNNYFYYGFIKHIYNYKTGDMLTSFNDNNAKHFLIDTIENRKWNEFTKPNIYKAIMCTYQINNNDDFIKQVIVQFNYLLLKMFSIWTIMSIFECIWIGPLISFFILLYKFSGMNIQFYTDAFVIFLVFIFGIFFKNYFLISFFCQFGGYIIRNKILYKLSKLLKKNIIFGNNKLIFFLIANVIYISFIKIIEYNYLNFFINIIFNTFTTRNIKENMMLLIIILSTYISDYNIFHIIFNSMILYALNGIKIKKKIIIDKSNIYKVNIKNSFIIINDYYK